MHVVIRVVFFQLQIRRAKRMPTSDSGRAIDQPAEVLQNVGKESYEERLVF